MKPKKKGSIMKYKLLAALVIGGLALAIHSDVLAADREMTITGEGACAKCILKETKECQHTITATDEVGKKATYYVAQNNVAKEFGNQFCTDKKKAKAIGTVSTVDGKLTLTPKKIELVKD
jgi:hypothetical protein